jgi:hypothetical protein
MWGHRLAAPSGLRVIQLGIIMFAVMVLSGCAPDVPPIFCNNTNFRCMIDHDLGAIKIVRQNISLWSDIFLIVQFFIAISGMVATVMIALQGDLNKYWTRPIGLVATALVTALTSALVSFHVPENIDKLIDIVDRMTTAGNEFDYNVEKLRAGRSQEEVDEAYKNDPKFHNDVNNVTQKFSVDFNKIKIDMLRINGTATKLNVQTEKNGGNK